MDAQQAAPCAAIIVTHNSQEHLPFCLKALKEQSVPLRQIIIVDSGSRDVSYLQAWQNDPAVVLHCAGENVGFCRGNNLGLTYLDRDIKYLLYLNPDAFLTPYFIKEACALMEDPSCSQVGALSGILLGYEMQSQRPTGLVDSTGIFRTWYGRWYDRYQGCNKANYFQENVPALCGALMFCRLEALQSVALSPGVIMDPDFFMYKEDIDLSLRLRCQGWNLLFIPALEAYHCRGWAQKRKQVPRKLRLLSARNEMRLYARMRSPCYIYSALKYWMVKLLNW